MSQGKIMQAQILITSLLLLLRSMPPLFQSNHTIMNTTVFNNWLRIIIRCACLCPSFHHCFLLWALLWVTMYQWCAWKSLYWLISKFWKLILTFWHTQSIQN